MAGKGSFAYRGVGQEGPPGQSAATLEHQQAVLLKVLRGRRGMGVSFTELQEAGIEFPASVVSELELAGVPIERCVLRAQGASTVGVRLDPAWPRPPAPQRDPVVDERTIVRRTVVERRGAHDLFSYILARYRHVRQLAAPWMAGLAACVAAMCKALATAVTNLRDGRLGALATAAVRSRDGSLHDMRVRLADVQWSNIRPFTPVQWMSRNAHHKRLLAPAGLLVVIGVTVALVVGHLDTGMRSTSSAHGHTHSHARTTGSTTAGSTTADSAHTGATGPAGHTPSAHVPVSPKLAAELQLQGHELLGAGEYVEAAHVLNKALAASGKNVQSCLQPVSEACLTYAYALYDLGRALMLSGSPAAAVPVLERRLQIENQRPAVADALEQARAQMG